jgi:hypothetical protein
MWLSLVERCVRDAEVAGSNPVIPTIFNPIGMIPIGSGSSKPLLSLLFTDISGSESLGLA